YSCLQGDCPSFVTVEIEPNAKKEIVELDLPTDIPLPTSPTIPASGYSVLTVGIGGTGLVTLNQILATAAAFDGLHVIGLDQTGLSQKGGPVASHIKITKSAENFASSISERSTDLLFALDMLVANEPQHRVRLSPERTRAVISSSVVATSSMVIDTDQGFGNKERIIDSLKQSTIPGGALVEDFVALAEHVFKDHMPANLIALGAAYQFGALPISKESIESAITVNGAAVERSLLAFRLGRLVVADPQFIAKRVSTSRPGSMDPSPSESAQAQARTLVTDQLFDNNSYDSVGSKLTDFVSLLGAELIDYQNLALAQRYVSTLAPLVRRELEFGDSEFPLSHAAALHLFRLMAYKDEYEVARLHLKANFQSDIGRMVPNNHKKRYLLQPPIMKSLGLNRKIKLSPVLAHPTFHVLRAMKGVRGTSFDPFARADMRRLERSLVDEYSEHISAVTAQLNAENLDACLRVLQAPDLIRGFEGVKRASLEKYYLERDMAMADMKALRAH
ncbi:MAG: DUF6537 domain-containing protein, partial [Ilumatobacteraceae bacterium]